MWAGCSAYTSHCSFIKSFGILLPRATLTGTAANKCNELPTAMRDEEEEKELIASNGRQVWVYPSPISSSASLHHPAFTEWITLASNPEVVD
jgi:hypothetical protein